MNNLRGRTVLVMPGVACDAVMRGIAALAIDSCTQTSDAIILFMDNGGGRDSDRIKFAEWVVERGHEYRFMDPPFNQAAYFNEGFAEAYGRGAEYIFAANFDLEFKPMWLQNLVRLWQHHREYYCLAPYSGSDLHKGLCYRSTTATPENIIVDCDHPSGWLYGFKGNDFPVFDVRLKYWNVDSDIHKQIQHQRKKSGVAYNSRVDHLADAVKNNCPANFGFDIDAHKAEADAAFQKKWGVK